MKERPVLFSGAMVRAILEGRKTQTRRVVKFDRHDGQAPHAEWNRAFPSERGLWVPLRIRSLSDVSYRDLACPYGHPGDRLWVRETWGAHAFGDETDWCRAPTSRVRLWGPDGLAEHGWGLAYRADWGSNQESCHWRPSIFLPRWASRITLEVTGVRVERLHAITEEDARAEGMGDGPGSEWALTEGADLPRLLQDRFEAIWRSINGAESWDANPWVWVVEFKRVQP